MFKFLTRPSKKDSAIDSCDTSTAGGSKAGAEGFAGGSATSPPVFRLPLQLRTAVTCLPHPDKVHYGGEDAYFVSHTGGGALGVADGVGGWAESGVNPAEYSRTLMRLACAFLEGRDIFAAEADEPEWEPFVDPRGALHAAHMNTKVAGSATACVMQLDQQSRSLNAANLGDSGFLVYRAGRAVAKTRPLQHYFDCPLQFGAFPEFVEATDTADMAEMYNVPLEVGDVIVAGSDGLWDNCFETEVAELLPRDGSDCQAAANRIAMMARGHAEDPDFPSPYTREALSQGLDLAWWDKILGAGFRNGKFQLKQLTGGKIDDITVLVSYVDEVQAADDVNADGGSAFASALCSPAASDAARMPSTSAPLAGTEAAAEDAASPAAEPSGPVKPPIVLNPLTRMETIPLPTPALS